MPIIDTIAGNCVSIGSALITNYKSTLNYIFNPPGPTVNASGKILNLNPGVQYSVRSSENKCNSNPTPYFSIDPIKPLVVPAFFTDKSSGCTPLSYSLTASFQPGIVYQWYANGLFIGSGSIISGVFESEDCYDISLTVSNSLGCSVSSTSNDMICAKQTPIADFSVNTTTLISSFQEISFKNNSKNAFRYVWDFGNGDTSSLINPSYYYEDISDDINVRLFAYSANDCFDSTAILLRFIEDASFYVPNTFTPDKDEFNETWGPVFTQGYEPYYFEIQVANRWGEIIWESYDAKSRWNGTYGNTWRECPDGVYVWKIICRPKQTTMKMQLTGSIHLIR
jgi:gliding motility-associated-like protein